VGKARWVPLAALGFALLCPPAALAGVADPDPSFGKHGLTTIPFGADASANAVAIAPDGDIVVAGTAESNDGDADVAIARLNPDGSLDDTFSGDGRTTIDVGDNDGTSAVAVRPDGRIVVAGGSVFFGFRVVVIQLLPNGELDEGFGQGGIVTSLDFVASDLVLDASGNVVLAGEGESERPEGGLDAVIARLTPDGRLDPSFGGNGRVTIGVLDVGSGAPSFDSANGVVIEPDGEIVFGGSAFLPGEVRRLYGRIASDGTVLEVVPGAQDGVYTDATLLASGQPLLTGYSQPHNAPYGAAIAALISADGFTDWELQPVWTDDPLAASTWAVSSLRDGRALAAGRIEADSGAVEYDLFLIDPETEAGFVACGEIDFEAADVAASGAKTVIAGEASSDDGQREFAVRRFLAPRLQGPNHAMAQSRTTHCPTRRLTTHG
jgi:uncharacterized delta-60 repeat protein